jgi:hypothetical protein
MSSPVQTTIDTPLAGLPGAPCDDHAARHNRVETCLNEEASAAIPFGYAVKQGTAERKCKLPSAKTDRLIGFATYSPGYVRNTQLADNGIQPKTYLGVTTKGGLWIMPEEDVAVGDGVHVRVTANAGKLPGQVGKTDDGVRTIDISPFAEWRTAGGTTSGQPAKLVFDFVNASLAHTDS